MDSREEFINKNIGLVHSLCRKMTGKGIEYDDLFQAGCIGLIKATDGFDETRGLCFSTYAVPVILGEIKRLFRDGGTVKVSRSLKELAIKIKYEIEKSVKKDNKEPSVEELAERLGVEKEEIAEAMCATQPTVSLTYESEDGTKELDLTVNTCGEDLTNKIMLDELLTKIEPKDRALIRLRYYLGKTQNETAAILSMTQVQVSRSERRILSNMRDIIGE